ncbi:hypothetical protein F3J40_17015 [Pantoea sp. Acro-835]|uniref:Uncharacterized protein n=2 Tax=Candidatus Pantoea multigeneris TaxID=2608357 RepID=A0ABX0RD58_9GAMM|nr:hypothetical protein [Pantoea multigeneris]
MNKIEHVLPTSWLSSETNGKVTKDSLHVMHQAQEEIAALRFRQAIEMKSEKGVDKGIKHKRNKILRIHGLNVLYNIIDAYRDIPKQGVTRKVKGKSERHTAISTIGKNTQKSSVVKKISALSQIEDEEQADIKNMLADNYQIFEEDELGSFKLMDALLTVRTDIPFIEKIEIMHQSLMKDYRVTDYLSNTIIGKVKRDVSLLQSGKGMIYLIDEIFPATKKASDSEISNSTITVLLLKIMKNSNDKINYHELLMMVNIESSQPQQIKLYRGLRKQPIVLWENQEYRLKKLHQMSKIMKALRTKNENNNKMSFLDSIIFSGDRKI